MRTKFYKWKTLENFTTDQIRIGVLVHRVYVINKPIYSHWICQARGKMGTGTFVRNGRDEQTRFNRNLYTSPRIYASQRWEKLPGNASSSIILSASIFEASRLIIASVDNEELMRRFQQESWLSSSNYSVLQVKSFKRLGTTAI